MNIEPLREVRCICMHSWSYGDEAIERVETNPACIIHGAVQLKNDLRESLARPKVTRNKIRQHLVDDLNHARRALHHFDLANNEKVHKKGCPCPRATCTMARITPINDKDIHEALKNVGL